MCRNVIIHYTNGSEKVCETEFDLLKEMPNGITNYDQDFFDGSCCLCQTDLKQTAVLNGFISSYYNEMEEYDPFDVHFYQI
jgi:hypothetical protein